MRKFLVVLDDSRECLNAMRFAAMRASKSGGQVTIVSVNPPEEYQHWMGVAEIMRDEARDRIEAHFEVFAKWMRDRQGVNPELVIREGEPLNEKSSIREGDELIVTKEEPALEVRITRIETREEEVAFAITTVDTDLEICFAAYGESL